MDDKWCVAAVALIATATGVVGGHTPTNAAGETGRITLAFPYRIVDTRFGPPIDAGADHPLGSGLLTFSAKPRANGAGEADVFPCAGSADTEPTFRFDDDGFITRSIVASNDVAMCLRSSVGIDLIVDRHGSIGDLPFVGGLQYEPLLDPELVVESDFVARALSTTTTDVLADVAGYTTDVPVSYWDVVIV